MTIIVTMEFVECYEALTASVQGEHSLVSDHA